MWGVGKQKMLSLWWSSWLGQRMLFNKITQGRLKEAVEIIARNKIALTPNNLQEHLILSAASLIFSQWLKEKGWVKKQELACHRAPPQSMQQKTKPSLTFDHVKLFLECQAPSDTMFDPTFIASLLFQVLQNIEFKEREGLRLWVYKMAPVYESQSYKDSEAALIVDFLFKDSLSQHNRNLHESEWLSASRLGLLSLMDSSLWTPSEWVLAGNTVLDEWFAMDTGSSSGAFLCADVVSQSWENLDPEKKERFISRGYERIGHDFLRKIVSESTLRFFNLMLEIKGVDAVAHDFQRGFGIECSPSVFALLCRHYCYGQFEHTWGTDFRIEDALTVVTLPLCQDDRQFEEDQKHWEALFDFFHCRFGKEMAVVYKAIEDALRKETDEQETLGYAFLRKRQLKFSLKQGPLSNPSSGDSFIRF